MVEIFPSKDKVASNANVLRGSSRVRGVGTRDEPLRTFAWEAKDKEDSLIRIHGIK